MGAYTVKVRNVADKVLVDGFWIQLDKQNKCWVSWEFRRLSETNATDLRFNLKYHHSIYNTLRYTWKIYFSPKIKFQTGWGT